ncbi:hypothetical protein DQ04_03491040 [Trypanosoma grayi]|uniref:hypothetical protein n=1 Tax=Trypanosoma grayi TaxID=71804 RepID=UPI0004F439E2|nr:hypothetical protein DQ04_03491040 [Trypanosoma grayi]KEG10627.1 hypothetical protein DQ04_03491040 [Trypanosoma grayi]
MSGCHSRVRALALLCCIALSVLTCPTVLAEDPPQPTWSKEGCSSGFSLCANVTTKESWADGGKNIYFLVDVLPDQDGFNNTNVTVWYVGENYQDTWAYHLSKIHFNVVRFSPRGSDLAYPQINCRPEYFNEDRNCYPSVSCAEEIARSGLNLARYSIEETANDLAWVLETLGSGKQNVVVAEGLGTFIVQQMLQTKKELVNVSVIMADFTHPEHFDTFESFNGYDGALQRLLRYCDDAEGFMCATRVGAFEGMWNRFVNVMTAAKLGTLKCNTRLRWGVKPEEMHREYRAVVAALLKNPQHFLLEGQTALVQLLPSFIYRLQRCNDGDVAALEFLYGYITAPRRERCPPFIPQRYNWLVNELTLVPPMVSPQEFLDEMSLTRLVVPNITAVQPFFDVYNAYPKYRVPNRSIAKTETKMLLLLSDVDPVFPFVPASLAANAYGADVRILPHQNSFPVATSAEDCISRNLQSIRTAMKWTEASQCKLTADYKLDFNLETKKYYGVVDAWEFTTSNAPEILVNATSTSTAPSPGEPGHDEKCSKGGTVALAVFFVLSLVALGGVSYLYWRQSRVPKFSDDFYSNLSR